MYIASNSAPATHLFDLTSLERSISRRLKEFFLIVGYRRFFLYSIMSDLSQTRIKEEQRSTLSDEITKEEQPKSFQQQQEEKERKTRVEEAWKNMNMGLPAKTTKPLLNKPFSAEKGDTNNTIPEWMIALGLVPVKSSVSNDDLGGKSNSKTDASEETKKLAAAALQAVKDSPSGVVAAGSGKIEINEVRDFAGENIEVKKLVDADSKEALEKAKALGGLATPLDNILEQIKKKPKLSVLDKTKKDWSEFKDDNKGLEDQLESYKKSSNQYLDKVSFLNRADHREFERERDARLAMQSKRRSSDTTMGEDN